METDLPQDAPAERLGNARPRILALCIPHLEKLDQLGKEPLIWLPWVRHFFRLAQRSGDRVMSGRDALGLLQRKAVRVEDIRVIAGEDSGDAHKLLSLGAPGACLIVFESPAVKWRFIDKLKRGYFDNRYWHIMAREGLMERSRHPQEHIHPFIHSAFDLEDLKPIVPWNERKFLIFISGLRLDHLLEWPAFDKQFWSRLRFEFKKACSPTFWYCRRHELQTRKLEAILHFAERKRLDLMGYGWESRERLPRGLRERFDRLGPSFRPAKCQDKFSVTSRYKFNLAFENVDYPGYVSEKITHCFVAGTIPIYLGTNDWKKHFPPEAVIDAKEFGDWEELEMFMDALPASRAEEMLLAGRAFLQSERGLPHMHEWFARKVFQFCEP